VREPEAIANARDALGTRLAACRHAVGLNQAQLAERIGFSRSTIANVETGRQHAPREFWQSADTAVSAGGSLLAAHDDLEATASQARAQSIQMTRAQPPIALPVISAAGHPLWGAPYRSGIRASTKEPERRSASGSAGS
jgi:DNA-binding XRE family transcriptional regulator